MTTARETWKNFERRVATILGGVRVPVTGRARGSAPDVAHPAFAIECKYRTRRPALLDEAMRQAKASVRGEQLPIVIVGQKHEDIRRALVVIELGDFADWYGK